MSDKLTRIPRLLKKKIPKIFRNVNFSALAPFQSSSLATYMDLDSGTGDVNGGEGNFYGDDDGGSSHFQKTVCLYDWWLSISENELQGKTLAVGGSTSTGMEPVRLFTSASITKRYDAFTMETADGICVVLQGYINKPQTEENGFSSEIFNHFVYGFPRHWEECYQSCLGTEINKETESGGVADFTKPATDLAESSPSLSKRKDEEAFGEDRHNCDINVDSSGIVTEDINVAAAGGSFKESSRYDKVEMGNSLNVGEQIKANDNRDSDRQHNMPNLSNGVGEMLDASKLDREADKATISPRAGNRKSRRLLRNKRSNQKNNHEYGRGITFDVNRGSDSQSHMVNLSSVVEESVDVSQSEQGVNKTSANPRAKRHMPNLSNGVDETLNASKSEREDDKATISPHAGDIKSRRLLRNRRTKLKNNHEDRRRVTSDVNRGSESHSHMANLSSVVEESMDASQSEQGVDKASINRRAKRHKPNLSNGVEETLDASKSEREDDKATMSPHAGNRKSRRLLRNRRTNLKNNHINIRRVTFDVNRGSESHSRMANLYSAVEENLDVSQSGQEVNKASISPLAKNRKTGSLRNRSSQKNNPIDRCSMKTKDQKLTPETSKPLDPKTLKKNSSCKEANNEERYISRENARRKIHFETQASPSIPERKGQSITSPESLNCKRSRSGRLILPPLDFWRNQVAVYDVDRSITGVEEEEENFVKLSGSRSEQKWKKKFTEVSNLTTEYN